MRGGKQLIGCLQLRRAMIADAPLTVMQTLPVAGVVIVSTPQDLASMVVRKAVTMSQKIGKKIFGVVENMSYLEIPETGKRMELFGKSRGQEVADAANAPLLAQLPIDPKLAALCDAGDVEKGAQRDPREGLPGSPDPGVDGGVAVPVAGLRCDGDRGAGGESARDAG